MFLKFVKIEKYYGKAVAVGRVSFAVPAGQFCVILGSSGAGKSTLLRMINGMVEPTAGHVEYEGMVVNRRTLRSVQARVAMIHQQFHLAPRLGVLKNVLSGALASVSTPRALLGCFPRELQRRACRLLAEVGLDQEHLYRRVSKLSGGQQQRVAIARAFILLPDLVLADEPVASLDPTTSRAILDLLRRASRQHGATVLCSLHQIDLALEFADRIVGLRGGQVVFDGAPGELNEQTIDSIYKPESAAGESVTEQSDSSGQVPAELRV